MISGIHGWLFLVFSVDVIGKDTYYIHFICPCRHLLVKLLVCLIHLLQVFSTLLVEHFLVSSICALIRILFRIICVCRFCSLAITTALVDSVAFFSMATSITLRLSESTSPSELSICRFCILGATVLKNTLVALVPVCVVCLYWLIFQDVDSGGPILGPPGACSRGKMLVIYGMSRWVRKKWSVTVTLYEFFPLCKLEAMIVIFGWTYIIWIFLVWGPFFLVASFMSTTDFVPSGANGVLLKSYIPLSCWYADNFWFLRDILNIFN